MNSQKEDSTKKGDRADSSFKVTPQQYTNQSDSKSDTAKEGTDTHQPKFAKQGQSDEKTKTQIDPERRADEEILEPKEFPKKDNTAYTDKTDRL